MLIGVKGYLVLGKLVLLKYGVLIFVLNHKFYQYMLLTIQTLVTKAVILSFEILNFFLKKNLV